MACDLCDGDGGEIIFRDALLRVVLVDDTNYPGFCRVICNAHVKEMSDFPELDRARMMAAVWAVEAAMIATMAPDKINLASLGNMTPHVHWHVIARYLDDAHFPNPVWAPAARTTPAASNAARLAMLPALRAAIVRRLG